MDIWPFGREQQKKKNASDEQGRTSTKPDANAGVAGGCLGILAQVGVWVLSAVLVTVGLVLFLFGVLDFSEGARFATLVSVVLAPIGIFLLLRVGRAILRDMRKG